MITSPTSEPDRRRQGSMRTALCALPALLALATCHDARRDNPLDPGLTPAPVLQAVLDVGQGVVHLTWTRYEGEAPFAAYWVLRKVQGFEAVDTVRIADVGRTALVDTIPPNTAYEYRVSAVNAAGLERPSATHVIGGYPAGPVELAEVEVDGERGTAALRWSRFPGPRFAAYRVERIGVLQDDYDAVARVEAVSDTSWVDRDLRPDAAYRYRVVVEAAGREWASSPSDRQGFSLRPVDLLQARADSLAGLIALRWTRFRGPGFSAYRILRRPLDDPDAEEISLVGSLEDTTWRDTSALHAVDYEYRLSVEAAGQVLDGAPRLARLALPPVRLTGLDLSSTSASARLAWTPYRGPRFEAYEISRRTSELAARVVSRLDDPAQTRLVDTGLAGATEYLYEVAVVTTRGERIAGLEMGGAIHRLVDTWPLAMDAGGGVRLYAQGGGAVAAVISGESGIRLILFDRRGDVLGQEQVTRAPASPRHAAAVLLADGRRCFTVASPPDAGAMCQDASGRPIFVERRPFEEALPDLDEEERLVAGIATLRRSGVRAEAAFDTVTVSDSAAVVFADGFDSGPRPEWDTLSPALAFEDGRAIMPGDKPGTTTLAQIADPAWGPVRLEVELSVASGGAGIEIGGRTRELRPDVGSTFRLTLEVAKRQATLVWTFRNTPARVTRFRRFEEPMFLLAGVPHRLRLAVEGRRLVAAVASPLVAFPAALLDTWGAMAAVGEFAVVAFGDAVATLSADGRLTSAAPLPAAVSELRTWTDDRGHTWIGLCYPQLSHVLIGRTAVSFLATLTLPSAGGPTTTRVGAGLGQGPGQLLAPLSFDVDAGGRVFVLDAGNGRVQVFGPSGDYLTQWGQPGAGPAEFDFGGGSAFTDFRGSLAVDAAGFVYVADPGNRRIQVFEP